MKTYARVFAVAVILAGCSADPHAANIQTPETESPNGPEIRIRWLQAPSEVGVGDRVLFSAAVTGDIDTGVLWSSSPDPTAIDRAGTFQATQAGTYYVVAASRKDPAVFVESEIHVNPIIDAPYALSLTYGETVTLTAIVAGVDAPKVAWHAAGVPTGTSVSSNVIHAGSQSGHFNVIATLAGWPVTHTVEVSVSETNLWWWVMFIGSYGAHFDGVLDNVVATSDGGFAISGTVYPSSKLNQGGWISKFDSKGRLSWIKGGFPAFGKAAEISDLLCVRAHCVNISNGDPVTSFSVSQVSLLGTRGSELVFQGRESVLEPYLAFLEITSGTLRKVSVGFEFNAAQSRNDGNILLYSGDTLALMTVTGTPLWARRWTSAAPLLVSPSGRQIYRLDGGQQAASRLTRIDENGIPVWTKSFAFKYARRQSGCTLSSGSVTSLTTGTVRDDGSVTVIGLYSDSCTRGSWIAEIDASGTILWQRRMPSSACSNRGTLIALSNDDYVVVSAYPHSSSGIYSICNIHSGGLGVPKPGTWSWKTGFSTIDAISDISTAVSIAVGSQDALSLQGSTFSTFDPNIFMHGEDDDGSIWTN